MSTRFICSLFVTIVLQGAFAAGVTSAAIVRTERFDFKPTLIAQSRTETLTVPVRALPPGEYSVLEAPTAPFRFNEAASDLRTVNGQIVLSVTFRPLSEGSFTNTLLLQRTPFAQPDDTIRVVISGFAFRAERTVALEFGTLFIGDTAAKPVVIDADLADEERWISSKQLRRPFFNLTPNGPIGTGPTREFVFSFKPVTKGEFTDTVGLIRTLNSTPLDTIVVLLRGRAIAHAVKAELNFGTVITRDSVARTRSLSFPNRIKGRYTVIHNPEAPFTLLFEDVALPAPNDSLIIGIAVVPTKAGDFIDSLLVQRNTLNDVPLDTIVIRLSVEARAMPEEQDVGFTGVRVGDTAIKRLEVLLPVAPENVPFVYRIEPTTVDAFTGIVTSPQGASTTTPISLMITAMPTTFGSSSATFYLVRYTAASEPIDSTAINVAMQMLPRPPVLSVRWQADTINAKTSDTVVMELELTADGDIDESLAVTLFEARIPFNPTVFVPLPASNQQIIYADDSATIVISISNLGTISAATMSLPITAVRGIVTLGDAAFCDLPVAAVVEIEGKPLSDIEAAVGRINVTDIWTHQGGVRLVNPSVGALQLAVAPNPVVTSSIISVANVPEGEGSLTIFDSQGTTVRDLTADLRSGIREWIVSSGGNTSTSLASGSYYVRLAVAANNGTTINTVARLFIVE